MSRLSIIAIAMFLGVGRDAVADEDAVNFLIERAEQVSRHVPTVTRDMQSILTDEKSTLWDRAQAATLLGRFRSIEGVPALVDHLLLKTPVADEWHPLSNFPAAKSVAAIGSPAYPAIWRRIDKPCSEQYLKVLAFTLVAMDGRAVVEFRLTEQLRADKITKLKRENVAQLQSILIDTDLGDLHSWPE